MPTYDYECDACGHTFELFQSITEPVQKKCPSCGKLKLRRLFGTGAAVVFKGSGFYQTDYKQPAGGDKKADAETDDRAAKPGGCTPACGTKDAPAGCALNKRAMNKKKE